MPKGFSSKVRRNFFILSLYVPTERPLNIVLRGLKDAQRPKASIQLSRWSCQKKPSASIWGQRDLNPHNLKDPRIFVLLQFTLWFFQKNYYYCYFKGLIYRMDSLFILVVLFFVFLKRISILSIMLCSFIRNDFETSGQNGVEKHSLKKNSFSRIEYIDIYYSKFTLVRIASIESLHLSYKVLTSRSWLRIAFWSFMLGFPEFESFHLLSFPSRAQTF